MTKISSNEPRYLFVERLNSLMKDKDLTAKDLSRELEKYGKKDAPTPKTIETWRSHYGFPIEGTLVKLCNFFGVEEPYLKGLQDVPVRDTVPAAQHMGISEEAVEYIRQLDLNRKVILDHIITNEHLDTVLDLIEEIIEKREDCITARNEIAAQVALANMNDTIYSASDLKEADIENKIAMADSNDCMDRIREIVNRELHRISYRSIQEKAKK